MTRADRGDGVADPLTRTHDTSLHGSAGTQVRFSLTAYSPLQALY